MSISNKALALSRTVYFKVHIHGRMDLIPMEITPDGKLKYLGRYLGSPLNEVNIDSSL